MENMGIENLFGGIYKGRKVLVTGHTGFKGSWLVYWLQKLGATVYGLSLEPPTKPNHFSLIDIQCTSYIKNILEKESLKEILNEVNPEIIFHLAAQPLVRLSYEEPYDTYITNVIGTLNVLDASRTLKNLKALIIVTSDKCYKNNEWLWGYRENDPLGGNDPYSSSKACVEILTAAWNYSFFSPDTYKLKHNVLVASVRAGNVIGGGDWANERIIPDIVRATIQNQKVLIRYPSATRPWQHVLEPLSGYLTLGSKLLFGCKEFSGAWNFGPENESNIMVVDLVKEPRRTWNKINFEVDQSQHYHESGFLMLDSSKANRLLEWKPIWSFKKTIQNTIEWYKSF